MVRVVVIIIVGRVDIFRVRVRFGVQVRFVLRLVHGTRSTLESKLTLRVTWSRLDCLYFVRLF